MKKPVATAPLLALLCLVIVQSSCTKHMEPCEEHTEQVYSDKPFLQEYHESYIPADNPEAKDVRSIVVDRASHIWIATGAGVFVKQTGHTDWQPVVNGEARGPAYVVAVGKDSVVWLGTWDGVYSYRNGQLRKHDKIKSPVSVICDSGEGINFLGPAGVWLFNGSDWQRQDYKIARSIRDAVSDGRGGLWIATDVGLYHCKGSTVRLFQNEDELISCYLRGLSFDTDGRIWAGGLGGVTIRRDLNSAKRLTQAEGLPSVFVNSVSRAADGVMWVGTDNGIVRFEPDGSHSLLFSKRWLAHDKVNDIAFDQNNGAWIATAGGVSAIKRKEMTLAAKADYFYNVLMKRHIREPWIAGQCRLDVPGDTSSWHPMDDDNDGEYTSIYLAMESLRYVVTKDPDAREKAGKAFVFLKHLQEVTETDGFFARTIVPSHWNQVHDSNRVLSKKQIAEAQIRDPRYKPVETRWHLSQDGKWLWKGDTSSDEMCGHMMGYFYYYEFAADETGKSAIRLQVQKIMDYLIRHEYNLTDIDGEHTRWGVWSPTKLNHEPDWASEKSLNSFELLSFLKFAHHITGKKKYQDEYLRLINKENYLDNIMQLNQKNPAWFIYFDVSMAGYLFPILLKYETDPELKRFYEELIDEWFEKQIRDQSPLNNFIYCLARNRKREIQASVRFLTETPLDLVDWRIDHTSREDIRIVRKPTLEELQTETLVPPSIRATVRWDRNPWAAVNGNPAVEREPVFWLFPYWLGRYIGAIVN